MNRDQRAEVARVANAIAGAVERRGLPGYGLLRVVARQLGEDGRHIERLEARLAELEGRTDAIRVPERCAGCGRPIEQPAGRGRKRKWCGPGRCLTLTENSEFPKVASAREP